MSKKFLKIRGMVFSENIFYFFVKKVCEKIAPRRTLFLFPVIFIFCFDYFLFLFLRRFLDNDVILIAYYTKRSLRASCVVTRAKKEYGYLPHSKEINPHSQILQGQKTCTYGLTNVLPVLRPFCSHHLSSRQGNRH